MEDIEQIRKYIQDKLSSNEKADFELSLDRDSDLREEVEKERLVMKGIALAERERLKSSLGHENKTQTKYWYVVAALIPLLIISYLFIYDSQNTNSIYADYYEPYGVYEFGEVRGESERDELESMAFGAYKAGKYSEAYDLIIQLQRENNKVGYNLYAGICLLETEKYNEALKVLNQIPDSSKYYDIGIWYQSLTLIKLDQIDEASELLESLVEKDNGLAKKAKEILDHL
ncbi:tetratricopeptide repeat protein [Ekhidna sp.]|uniref:tetratricopeptide repeat protein n=1 Tax=Ekhidna sp. TaxID=2608089 RepID=UPI003CCB9189